MFKMSEQPFGLPLAQLHEAVMDRIVEKSNEQKRITEKRR